MAKQDDDPGPQELLPKDLRQDWVAAPRGSLYQFFLVGALLGAGISISVYGYLVNDSFAMLAFPIALGMAKLRNWFIPWERSARNQLRAWRDPNA